jgi:enoyl-CoA hydratase/3-hydroxyacyl-CoA dehydrogenase
MGPFRLSDLVGGDIGLHVGANFMTSFPDRVTKSSLIPLMNEAKRLGEKTGKGFYAFDKSRKASPDAQGIAGVVEASRKAAAGAGIRAPPKFSPSDREIIEAIFFPVVNEACRVVDEGIVDKAADLDVASVMAMGFPAYRGGIVFWADSVGAAYICKRLKELEAAVPAAAGFFRPCAYLQKCAAEGRKLGGGGASAAAKM